MKHISYAIKFLLLTVLLVQQSPLFAQQPVIGVVKDSKGSPLPSANVVVKGTNIQTVTDSIGQFKLTVNQEPPFFLTATFVGYKPQDFQILRFETTPVLLTLVDNSLLDEIVVTSRRRSESIQEVPIAISVVGGTKINESGAFNVNRVKELIPSVQLYTSNPRNTGINIRGIGSPFGLTNDGLDPGVGFYVDGVYYARPAAATLDFVDVERIEVLRGPQGTLFGKNTSAGAFNITTRKPSFTPDATFESSFGNFNYVQAKASVSGPLSKQFATRVSFSGTQRNGLIDNVATGRATNTLNNLGFHGQLLFKPSNNTSLTLAGDASDQEPDGYAQVVAGVVTTLRPAYRQFNAIIADLPNANGTIGYTLPSTNAFDRKIDHDTPWRSGNQLGGLSLNLDQKIGTGTLTSTSAWRYWNWRPSNDRDFTGLQAIAKSQNPSEQRNWSQEVRYAGDFSKKLNGVIGLFYIDQDVKTHGTELSGNAQWRFSQSSTGAANDARWRTPGLFDGYGIYTESDIKSQSAAVFGSLDWQIVDGLHFQPGVRYNYDKKVVTYNRVAKGGLQTTDPALLALKNGVYSSQAYNTDFNENNFTYSLTASYRPSRRVNTFATYSTSFKPSGVNVAGLPSNSAGAPLLDLAVIKPENTKHYEVGVKTTLTDNLTLNLTLHDSDIKDYQTNVQSPELGVNRGYLATAEKVKVKGIEIESSLKASEHFTFNVSGAYTDGKYVKFTNAPLPLELTGLTNSAGQQVAFEDISGAVLPGISKWAGSWSGEFNTPAKFSGKDSKFFIALDQSFRSTFSSSPTPSKYLNIKGYTIVNARVGFKAITGLSADIWSRNVFNKNYYEQLLVASGNTGQYAAVLGDQRTFGITLRYTFYK